jgi:nucleotide-binding universal stress UspA family protein
LVPLEGGTQSSQTLDATLELAHHRELEIVVLHVHSPATVPAFADHEPHATQAWEREFLARHINVPHAHVTLRRGVGAPADHILAVADETGADVVVLAWSQRFEPRRARVVTEVLSRARIPVLLLPAGRGHDRLP